MELGVRDVEQLLQRFGPASNDIVLIGGQAVNFWAERYLRRGEAALSSHAPFTSKDIDFCGGAADGQRCATAIDGTLLVPDMEDATPNTCVIRYRDASNEERAIDFLKSPFGLDRAELFKLRVPFPVEGSIGRLFVMHPVHCLESRTANVAALPGYATAHALSQLRAAVICARAFLRELLDANADSVRAVLKLNERIYRFSARNRYALKVFEVHGIDPFLSVTQDSRLPATFLEKRYPQMAATLSRRTTLQSRDRG